jgi:hypothetical protein
VHVCLSQMSSSVIRGISIPAASALTSTLIAYRHQQASDMLSAIHNPQSRKLDLVALEVRTRPAADPL